MKMSTFLSGILLFLSLSVVGSCTMVTGIFNVGMEVGIFIIIFILAMIAAMVLKPGQK